MDLVLPPCRVDFILSTLTTTACICGLCITENSDIFKVEMEYFSQLLHEGVVIVGYNVNQGVVLTHT